MAEGNRMQQDSTQTIQVFTDGSCLGNPGYGGWAALIVTDGVEEVITGRAPGTTTNNVMELTAAVKALEALPLGCSALLSSDSKYVVQGMTQWMNNWKRKGWRTYDKKPIANLELWKTLDTLNSERSIEWVWVKAHVGHPENERVDALANAEARKVEEALEQAGSGR
jgi:ribonuclease HI